MTNYISAALAGVELCACECLESIEGYPTITYLDGQVYIWGHQPIENKKEAPDAS